MHRMAESDASLVVRVRTGDAAAFEVLMRRHFRMAYLIALARVNDTMDAEDICQDAFVSAWQHIHECRDPDRFAPWLARIVRNSAHNRADYLRLRASEPLEHVAESASQDRTDARSLRNELRTRLLAALRQLSAVQREIVLLHDLEGWTHGEIAARADISELMSRRHLSDARKRLRALLGDDMTHGADDD